MPALIHLPPRAIRAATPLRSRAHEAVRGTPRRKQRAQLYRARARRRVEIPNRAAQSSRRSDSCFSPGGSAYQRSVSPCQYIAQLVSRAQQQHSHKRAAHPQRVGNLVITHFCEVAQNQRHPRPVRELLQTVAYFFAAVLRLQTLKLARIGMLERQRLQISRLQILPYTSPAQHIPAMIARNLIEPRCKGTRRVVGHEFLAYLHENFRRRILCVFARRQRPAAEPENRRPIHPVELAPGVCVARPDLGKHFRDFSGAHLSGCLSSLHIWIRRALEKISLRLQLAVPGWPVNCHKADQPNKYLPNFGAIPQNKTARRHRDRGGPSSSGCATLRES